MTQQRELLPDSGRVGLRDGSVATMSVASSADEAVIIAERVGYPVAVKIVSSTIIHKPEVGGIRLNVASAEDIPEPAEMDLNPLFALPPGQGCCAIDSRIRVMRE